MAFVPGRGSSFLGFGGAVTAPFTAVCFTTAWFPNDYEVDAIRYESHQPPLYYLLAAPVHRLTLSQTLNRQILALRLVSIAVGMIGIMPWLMHRNELRDGISTIKSGPDALRSTS